MTPWCSSGCYGYKCGGNKWGNKWGGGGGYYPTPVYEIVCRVALNAAALPAGYALPASPLVQTVGNPGCLGSFPNFKQTISSGTYNNQPAAFITSKCYP